MIKTLILQKGDFTIDSYGFNATLVENEDFQLIIQYDAVPDVIEGLQKWLGEQNNDYKKAWQDGLIELENSLGAYR